MNESKVAPSSIISSSSGSPTPLRRASTNDGTSCPGDIPGAVSTWNNIENSWRYLNGQIPVASTTDPTRTMTHDAHSASVPNGIPTDDDIVTIHGGPKGVDGLKTDSYGYHDKHQLPSPPRGMEWVFQVSTHRWALEHLPEAEITAVYPYDSNGEAPITIGHAIQLSDTLPGLCLKYGVTAMQIRRANNGFSGTNLLLAPNPLKIPNIHRAVPETKDPSQLLRTLQLAFRDELSKTEARCYLELNNWDLSLAWQNAKSDLFDQDLKLEEQAKFDTPVEQVVIDEGL